MFDETRFFKQMEEEAFGVPSEPDDETTAVCFDNFVKAKSGKAFGFYDGDRIVWSQVVWVPRSMIETDTINVERLKSGGFDVTMPAWFAKQKGVV